MANCLTAWKTLVGELYFFTTSICAYYYHIAIDNPHYEIYFVEIVKVFLLDRVFYTYIDHQPELYIQYGRIFAKGSLEVVYTRKTCFEFGATSNKVVKSLFAHRYRAMRRIEKIGYASYHIEPRRISSRIQVEYISYERFFFTFGQNILYISFLGLG